MTVSALLDGQVFGVLMVFARLGSALMFMPGFGEANVSPRARLALALVLCIALYPATPVPAVQPGSAVVLARLLAVEVTVGLWIGLTARALFSALQFAGYQIGQIAGLSNAFEPSLGSFQGATMLATFLLLGGIVLLFVTDTHYLIIRALLYSYRIFPFGTMILGDFARQTVKAVSASFYIGLTLSAPFLVMGLILNLGLGLANRMMPTLPVFFVASSALIAVALAVFAVAAPTMLHYFIARFADWLGTFTL